MLNCADFYNALTAHGIDFFCGVPDSLLKDFCAYITDNAPQGKHIITANEGNAIALAAGVYLSTGKPALVYMQNSGQGNAVNPLVSLADEDVYQIPLLMLIGWRGEPGIKDEPQHAKQGKITLKLLETLNIPYSILPDNKSDMENCLNNAISEMRISNAPYALIIKKGTFETYKLQNNTFNNYEMTREDAIKIIVDNLGSTDVIISTTGMTSRELYEYREALNQTGSSDFLTVGSMGHSSAIALGMALNKPSKQVFCLDGDGAAIMHLGAFTTIGTNAPTNFKHILINNGAHDSVGGQPTCGFKIDFCKIAIASNYEDAFSVDNAHALKDKIITLKEIEGPALLEIKVKKGARKDLGRPKSTPIENKNKFMEFLRQ